MYVHVLPRRNPQQANASPPVYMHMLSSVPLLPLLLWVPPLPSRCTSRRQLPQGTREGQEAHEAMRENRPSPEDLGLRGVGFEDPVNVEVFSLQT